MRNSQKSITLYDFGGGILILVMFGLPFGSIIDYIWNRFVLSQALRHLMRGSSSPSIELASNRVGYYAFFITVIGLLIDWGYHELIWDVQRDFSGINTWVPTMDMSNQLILVLFPMVLLLMANFFLSVSYLKLGRRQALFTGLSMAFFTAPWIVPIFPYIAGWTG